MTSAHQLANPADWKRLRERSRPWMIPALVGAGVGLVGLAVLVPLTAKAADTGGSKPTGVRDAEELGLVKLKGRRYVEAYLDEAERVSKIKGLATFGLAASKRESGWNNMAVNDSKSEAASACKAWDYQKVRKLKDTPYQDPKYWCWGTGGWFGQMPAYALAREPFRDLNPIWAIHDPATSTAMFTAAKAGLIKGFFPKIPPEHRNWLAVRRSMASLKTFYDYKEEGDRAKAVRRRFEDNLKQIGVDPSFMYERPSAADYPGNAAVWDALQAVQPTQPKVA